MSDPTWRCVSASVIGTSHVTSGTVCQDSNLCSEIYSMDGPILLAFASDGAGSAARSAEGSRMLCEIIRDQSIQFFAEQGTFSEINSRLVAGWIERFRDEVIVRAGGAGVSDREFACTLIGAIASPSRAAFFQIGDGAIVYSASAGGPYKLAFWPSRGEYENTTFFATHETFFDQLQFTTVEQHVSEIALLSDGLQRIALDYSTKEAHQPFFRGFFPSVQSTAEIDLQPLREQLAHYLNSARINERTDDDKTLVLAVAPSRGDLEEGESRAAS